ncbi:hypothetical protein E4U54_000850 [Claviceps lovelessii]|nr:hypothetical protein E4U54_000850 [Claviceps lovelessii]
MSVTHIVSLSFKADVAEERINQCCQDLLALKNNCILASTQKPYILNSKGGKDMSIENLQNGFTHVFVTEFASVADRDYYVKEDEVHRGFVEKWIASADGVAAKALVLDFVAGSL